MPYIEKVGERLTPWGVFLFCVWNICLAIVWLHQSGHLS